MSQIDDFLNDTAPASGIDAFLKDAPSETGGGILAAAKQSMGSVVKGLGQAGEDFLPGDIGKDNAVKKYGQSVIDANPTSVNDFDELMARPGMAIREAVGNAAGSMGPMLGARAIGMGITAASPLTGPFAPAVAGAGQLIANVGPFIAAAAPSFGSIRENQIAKDPSATDSWHDKAVAATGAGTVGLIEGKFGPQAAALKMMTKEGRDAIAKKFAETTLAKGIGYGALKGAATEGAEELVQNPIEQLSSYSDPRTAENVKETLFGGAMGALGGGVLGGGMGAVNQAMAKNPDTPTAPPPPVDESNSANADLGLSIDEYLSQPAAPLQLETNRVIAVPRQDGMGMAPIDRDAGPLSAAAADAQESGLTEAMNQQVGPLLKSYATPAEAEADMMAREDADRLEVGRHPRATDRYSVLPKSAMKLEAMDAKASLAAQKAQAVEQKQMETQAANETRTQQVEQEDGNAMPAGAENAATTIERAILDSGQNSAPALANIAQAATESIAPTVDEAAHAAATSDLNDRPQPTDAQKSAGNYAKGHIRVGGLDMAIENPVGSTRSGTDTSGKPWSVTMGNHYGYIKATTGNDKDQVDTFVKRGTSTAHTGPVFVVDQVDPSTGRFDEHKAMVGFENEAEAKAAYQSNYAKGWTGMKAVTAMSMDQFKAWVKDGPKRLPASQDARVQEAQAAVQATTAKSAPQAVQAVAEEAAQAEVRQSTGKQSTPRLERIAGETDEAYHARRAEAANTKRAERVQTEGIPTQSKDTAAAIEALGDKATGKEAAVTMSEMPDQTEAKEGEISKQSAAFINHVSKLFGKRVVFVSGMSADGMRTAGNVIYLSTQSSVAHLRVLGHEMLHALKAQNAKSYNHMMDAVKGLLTDDEYAAQYKDYYGKAAPEGAELSASEKAFLAEEWMADLSGNRFAEEGFWKDVFTQVEAKHGTEAAKGIVAKLRLALVNALQKLMKLVNGPAFGVDDRVAEHLDSIRKAIGEGFAEYAMAVKNGQVASEESAGTEAKFSAKRAPTDSPAFKKWFGEDSTLVNADGSPMVLYHGTTKQNERALGVFRRSKIGAMGPAIYLGDSKEASAGYADGAMMEVYARGKYLNNRQWTEYVNKSGWAGAEQAARADGFSGVYDSMFENAIAVWDSQDIKSATKNNGKFDPENPDIRFSEKRQDLFPEEFATKETEGDSGVKITSRGATRKGANVNSDGQQITATKQGVENFWKWFGDSAAANGQGRPLVLYHSTNSSFDAFEPGRETINSTTFGDVETQRHGIFTSPDKKFSQEYLRKGEGQNVMQVYASIQNPIDLREGINGDDLNAIVEAHGGDGRLTHRDFNYVDPYETWTFFDGDFGERFVAAAKAAGFDGAIMLEAGPDGNKPATTYVAFDAIQVKSTTGNQGSFSTSNNDIRFSEKRNTEPFYSALSKEVSALKMQTAPAFGWRDAIKGLVNKGLVKAEEIEWSGLNDWLELQTGKVTRDQVVQYLDANGVKVTETTLGSAKTSIDRVNREIEPEGYTAYEDKIDESVYFIDPDGDVQDYADLPEYIQKMVDKADGSAKTGPAKFEQYVVPGGENYREVLLTLPENTTGEVPAGWRLIDVAEEDRAEGFAVPLEESGPWRFKGPDVSSRQYKTRTEALAALKREVGDSPTGRYTSSHWEQKNVLAHLRLDDRTDADGNRVLFVQEVQSDWGQDGKKKGFAVPDGQLPDGWSVHQTGPGGSWYVIDKTKTQVAPYAETREAAIASAAPRGFSGAVPTAPFVTKTEGWLNLALKRVIKMAVDGGYDKVAFATGQQSADHYDLSKQISEVQYKVTGDSNYKLTVFDKRGHNVPVPKTLDADGLEAHVGKEIAQKIVDTATGETQALEGLDLKVGGEGMKTFYDKIVPIAAGKLAAKLGGGKVEMVRIKSIEQVTGNDKMWSPDGSAQSGITITDKMRESAAGGLPMFSLKRQTETPEFKKWFGDSMVVDADGKPLVVMHASPEERSTFDTGESRARTTVSPDAIGAWFSADQRLIDRIHKIRSEESDYDNYSPETDSTKPYIGATQQVFLSIKNPKVAKTRAEMDSWSEPGSNTEELKRQLVAKGFDGVHVLDDYGHGESWVAFYPTQIKSATGNNGDFDGTNPDIRFSPKRGTNDPMTNSDVVGNQGGRSADDTTPGALPKPVPKTASEKKAERIAHAREGYQKNIEAIKAQGVIYERSKSGSTGQLWNPDHTKVIASISNTGGTITLPAGVKAPANQSDAIAMLAENLGNSLERDIRAYEEQEYADDDAVAMESAWRDRIHSQAKFIEARRSGMWPNFTEAEKEEIDFYSDRRDKNDEGKKATVNAIERALKAFGIKVEHTSSSNDGKSKSLYVKLGDQTIRVSDHELPMTPSRENDRSRGLTGKWDREIIVFDWQNSTLDEYLSEIGVPAAKRLGYAHSESNIANGDTQNTTTNESTAPDSGGAKFSAVRTFDAPLASSFDDVVYKMQDKLVDTKRVVEAITKSVGKIADNINVYLQEELFHGRAAKRVADFGAQELKPLMTLMRMNGLDLEAVEEYLHARHAKEANALIAQREPSMPDGGSGMTNKAAADYMASLPAAQRAKLETVAKKVDAIIAKTRQTYADYGLESQATVDAWGSMFKSYVPLMREDKDGGMGVGQGFSVKGKEVKGRTGSTRKVVDIMANIAMQRERAIVRGEKNRVGQALLGLAQANPNPDFWTVRSQAPTERVYDPKKNAVVDRPDMMFKQRDSVLGAKVKDSKGNVVEQFVEFNESDDRAKRMAVALKNLDAGNLEGILGVSAKITRYFSSVNTQYNPVFGVVNLIRDVQGAMINLGSTPLAGKQAAVAKDTLAALSGIYGDIRQVRKGGVATSKWATLWEQMQADGGTTGYRDLFKTSADRANALKDELNPDAWMDSKLGKALTANGALKATLSTAKSGSDALFGWLSDYNEAMENGVRLAAYKAALDAGMTRQQAASLSKNLTVNFNRKGQVGQQAGALYAFFNAAMQGTAKIGQTLFDMDGGDIKTLRLSPLGKKVVYGGMLLGSMQALALAAAGFSDEDPPEFLRERSLIIPTGGKGYVSIPMPLGLHVIPGLGRHATEFALSGFTKPAKRAISMFGMFADAFNPIGNSGLSIQTIAPTAIDPLVALTENKDWTGKPIARVSSNKALPGHAQWKDTATGWSKVLAEGINLMSGGNQYVAGALSPTPDQIDYLIAQATGGVGREISKIEQTTKSLVRGEEIPTFKIPLAGRLYGNSASQASEGTQFYANADKLNELETEMKGLRKDGKHAEANALMQSRPEARLIMQVNHAELQVQKLKREKRAIIATGGDRALVRAKEEQITAVMARTNRATERLMEH